LGDDAACHKITVRGVLSVNGQDDLAEHNVLNLADAPLSPSISTSSSTSSGSTRFDTIFTRFYAELFGLVYRVLGDRMETEDTLQEAFLKLSDEAELQARPDVEVGAWLRRVAINQAFNRWRSSKRARAQLERVGRLEQSDQEPIDSDMHSPSGLVVRQEEQAAVRRALAEVPERQRDCLLLRHSGYSYAEIALTCGIAIGSVGVILARAEHAFRTTYRRQTHT
jgi:RNA polymerase sigma factor (sigma-70 family)